MANGEPRWLDEALQTLDTVALDSPPLRTNRLIQSNRIEPELHRAVLVPAKGPVGRPRFASLVIFKVLAMQQLHGLATDATSLQINDRHHFRAILSLTPAEPIEDRKHITAPRTRSKLTSARNPFSQP